MRRLLALLVLGSVACGPGESPTDAGSTRDARAIDAFGFDATAVDAAGSDGGGDLDAISGDAGDPPGTWRSDLFPGDWTPVHEGGAVDAEGRFLPDFSYAGWHRGEARPPVGVTSGTLVAVDEALADGSTDATAAIQAAIDEVCAAGGGVVELGEGTYRVTLPAGATIAISIDCSDIVLRGQGPDRTHVLFDDPLRARQAVVISARGGGSVWGISSTVPHPLAEDLPVETTSVTTVDDHGLAVGDWIVVRNDTTDAFRADHRMDAATSGLLDLWPASGIRGLTYVRRVEAIAGRTLTLEAPIRYPLRTRDAARLYTVPSFLSEVGLESFSIGMTESPTTTPDGDDAAHDDDYTLVGTTGYEVHASRAIDLDRVHDAWIVDVDSYAPPGNPTGFHLLSNGIALEPGAAHVTVEDCDWARPQYRGGGGNGYTISIYGNEILIRSSTVTEARHGITFNYAASGNVVRDVRFVRSRFSDDSHRFLAHANLYDRVVLESAWLQAVNRGTTSGGAGFTATQHVFWGTHVVLGHPTADGCAIESAQWGWGYLVGSSAEGAETARLCPTSFTNSGWAALDLGDPSDWVEGEAMGDTLFPTSLHQAMLDRRCARDGLACSW